MIDTGHKMAKGAAWMVALRLSVRLIGLASTAILARLLMPEDFGLVALATAVVAVLELFAAFSFDAALIQNRSASPADYSTAWTLNLALSMVVAILLVLLAAPVAAFYERAELANIFYALAAGTAISGFNNIGTVDFRKYLEFGKEFRLAMLQKIAGFVVVIPAALVMRNYWALIAGILASRCAGVIVSYAMHDFRPALQLVRWRELVRFSRWLLANNILYMFRHRSADFIIGKLSGAGQLGIFTVAYEIANLATTELAVPVERALFPGYAEISQDQKALRKSYLQVIALTAFIGLPAALGVSATAAHLIPLLLGANWMAAIVVTEILAIAASVSVLSTSAGSVCTALGRPHLLVPLGSIYVVVLVPALLILIPGSGGLGAAQAFLVAAVVATPVQVGIAMRQVEAGLGELAEVLWRPVIASVVMYGCVRLADASIGTSLGTPGHPGVVVILVVTGFAVYVSAISILWVSAGRPDGAEKLSLDQVRHRLRPSKSPAN